MPNYYWVNQGDTYKEELRAGCLWAPNTNSKGSKLSHWETMDLLTPGDIVFNYSKGYLMGFSVVNSTAVPILKPFGAGTDYSPSQGGRIVFCTYKTATTAVSFNQISSDIVLKDQLSSGTNPVLTNMGKVAQKYLCPISKTSATLLGNLLGEQLLTDDAEETSAFSKAAKSIAATTVKAIVDARLGQGKFRRDLEEVFGNACPITNLSISPLLRASHIKPWATSTNFERLDPENGILLAAGIDAAFDRGYVSFNPANGILITKPGITAVQLTHLGVPPDATLPARFLTSGRKMYLQEHQLKFKL